MEQRRRVPRRSTGWFGMCHIEGESDPEWRDCQVANVSSLGMGLRLQHFWPSEIVGRQITVEAPAAGDSINVRFGGVITHAERTAGGTDGDQRIRHQFADIRDHHFILACRRATDGGTHDGGFL